MNHQQKEALLLQYWMLIVTILMVQAVASIWIGWNHTNDVRAWWPLLIALSALVNFVYAGVFVAIIKFTTIPSRSFVVAYNSLLALIYLLHTYLYYQERIDWLAVSAGVKSLTVLQKIVHAGPPWYYGPYVVFLLGTIVICTASRKRARNAG